MRRASRPLRGRRPMTVSMKAVAQKKAPAPRLVARRGRSIRRRTRRRQPPRVSRALYSALMGDDGESCPGACGKVLCRTLVAMIREDLQIYAAELIHFCRECRGLRAPPDGTKIISTEPNISE